MTSNMEAIVQRLEAAVAKLEKMGVSPAAVASGAPAASGSEPAITFQLKSLLNDLDPLVKESEAIGPDVVKNVQLMKKNMGLFAEMLGFPFKYQKPANMDDLSQYINPIMKKLPPPPKGKQDNAVKALEASFDLATFLLQPVPIEFLKEQIGTVEYFNNRVRQDQSIEKGKAWAQLLTQFFKEFSEVIQLHYKNVKVAWTGSAAFGTAVQAQEKPAPAVEQKPAPAAAPAAASAKKEPKKKFDTARKIHIFENVENEDIEITSEASQSVQLFNCKKVNLVIKGKVNMIQIMKVTQSSVILETSISQIDIMQSKTVNIQVTKTAPTFNIENSNEITLFLSNQTAESSEIMMFCSDTIKVVEFEHEDEKDYAIPTHFVCKLKNGKMDVQVVDVGAE